MSITILNSFPPSNHKISIVSSSPFNGSITESSILSISVSSISNSPYLQNQQSASTSSSNMSITQSLSLHPSSDYKNPSSSFNLSFEESSICSFFMTIASYSNASSFQNKPSTSYSSSDVSNSPTLSIEEKITISSSPFYLSIRESSILASSLYISISSQSNLSSFQNYLSASHHSSNMSIMSSHSSSTSIYYKKSKVFSITFNMSTVESSIPTSSFYKSIASYSNQSSFQSQLAISHLSSNMSVTIFSHSSSASIYKKSTLPSSLYNMTIDDSSLPSPSFKSLSNLSSFQNQPSGSTSSSTILKAPSNSNTLSFYKKAKRSCSSFNPSIEESSKSASSFCMLIASHSNPSTFQNQPPVSYSSSSKVSKTQSNSNVLSPNLMSSSFISIASHSNQSSFNNISSASPFSSSISVIFSPSNPTLINKKSTVSSSSYFYSNTSTFVILNQTSVSTSPNSNPSSFFKKSTTISSSIPSASFFNRSISARHSASYLSSFAESSTSSFSFYMSITSYANVSSSQYHLSESSFILLMTLSHSNPASIYNKSTPSFNLFSSSNPSSFNLFSSSIIPSGKTSNRSIAKSHSNSSSMYKKSSTSSSSLNQSKSRAVSFHLLRKGILHSNISPYYSKLSSSSSSKPPSSNHKKSKLLLQSHSISSTPSSSFNLSRSISNSIIQKQILKSSYTSNLLRPTSSSLSPIFNQSSVSSFSSYYLSTSRIHSEAKSIKHQYYSYHNTFSPPSLSFCSSLGQSSFSLQSRLLQSTRSSLVTFTSRDSFSISINPQKKLSSKLSSSSTFKLRNCQSKITTLSTLSCSSLCNVLSSYHFSLRSISTSSISSTNSK